MLHTPGFADAVAICTAGISVTWTEALAMTLPERAAFLRAWRRIEDEREKRRPK